MLSDLDSGLRREESLLEWKVEVEKLERVRVHITGALGWDWTRE